MRRYDKEHVRVTLYLPKDVVDNVDQLADSHVRSRSGMVCWLLKRQCGMIGDFEKPEDIKEDRQ